MLKLNKNESPFDFKKSLKDKICLELANANWNRYIETENLVEKLEKKLSISKEHIILTSGNMHGIELFFNYIVKNNDYIQLRPSYSRYSNYSEALNLSPTYVDFLYAADFQNLLNTVISYPTLPILLCNPNNPTGLFLCKNKIKDIASLTQPTLFIDATYYFFSTEAVENKFKIFEPLENTVSAYSLSKAFSSAGIRLGFLIGDKKIINMLRKVTQPFTNYFSALCMEQILTEKGWDSGINNINTIIKNKKWLLSHLYRNNKLEIIDTETNFIFIKSKISKNTQVLYNYIEANNIQFKLCVTDIEAYIRITVGTKNECIKIISALNNWQNNELYSETKNSN